MRRVLDLAASGVKPAPEQFAAVTAMAAPGDRDAVRQRLFDTVEELYALRNRGMLRACYDLARDESFRLGPTLGVYRPPPEPLPTHPAELAKLKAGLPPTAACRQLGIPAMPSPTDPSVEQASEPVGPSPRWPKPPRRAPNELLAGLTSGAVPGARPVSGPPPTREPVYDEMAELEADPDANPWAACLATVGALATRVRDAAQIPEGGHSPRTWHEANVKQLQTILPVIANRRRRRDIRAELGRQQQQLRQLASARRPRARETRSPASRGIARSGDSGGTDPPDPDDDPDDDPDPDPDVDGPERGGQCPRHIAPILGAYIAGIDGPEHASHWRSGWTSASGGAE